MKEGEAHDIACTLKHWDQAMWLSNFFHAQRNFQSIKFILGLNVKIQSICLHFNIYEEDE